MGSRISAQEFQLRVKNIQEGMKQENFDALVVYSHRLGHATYISGYRPGFYTNTALVLVTLKRDPIMWIKFPVDIDRAKTLSWLSDIRPVMDWSSVSMFSECAEEIRSLGLDRSRIGYVAADLGVDEMPLSVFESFRARLPGAQLDPAASLLQAIRLIKSQSEVAALRGAAQLGDFVAETLSKELRPGQTERLAALEAAQVARWEGAESDMIIASTASRLAVPPSDLEFQKGGTVNCEINVRLDDYWIQICRSFSIGKARAAQREVFDVARRAYEAAVKTAKPGATVRSVADAALKVITEAHDEKCIKYGLGHGVGLDIGELYDVGRECESRLAPGMIFVIHPGVWVPDRGAAFVGGPIVVTEDGAAHLDAPQKEIFEV